MLGGDYNSKPGSSSADGVLTAPADRANPPRSNEPVAHSQPGPSKDDDAASAARAVASCAGDAGQTVGGAISALVSSAKAGGSDVTASEAASNGAQLTPAVLEAVAPAVDVALAIAGNLLAIGLRGRAVRKAAGRRHPDHPEGLQGRARQQAGAPAAGPPRGVTGDADGEGASGGRQSTLVRITYF